MRNLNSSLQPPKRLIHAVVRAAFIPISDNHGIQTFAIRLNNTTCSFVWYSNVLFELNTHHLRRSFSFTLIIHSLYTFSDEYSESSPARSVCKPSHLGLSETLKLHEPHSVETPLASSGLYYRCQQVWLISTTLLSAEIRLQIKRFQVTFSAVILLEEPRINSHFRQHFLYICFLFIRILHDHLWQQACRIPAQLQDRSKILQVIGRIVYYFQSYISGYSESGTDLTGFSDEREHWGRSY